MFFRVLGMVVLVGSCCGQDEVLQGSGYVTTGLSAEQALAKMVVPEGFAVDLIAAEPEVMQPVALAVDGRGRLWVAEAYSYPTRAKDGEGRDRILIFEDADGDGEFETRKVFYEGLNLVSGLEVGFGGVWVGAAPEFLFIADADGDDVADGDPEVLLDGWGYQDTHETLNSFLWGPDGWLYGCHGVFTHSKVGKPGTADGERVPLNAAYWRYHPTRHEFEVFAWGTSNSWGMDFNVTGQFFSEACVIPHCWNIISGARYQRQAGRHFNPHIYEDIGTIADHKHFIGNTPHSGNGKSDDAGGGHAHCGFLVYGEEQFPERYRGRAMFFNVHGHRINQERLERDRSGYVAKHSPDLLLTNDQWFMGVALKAGPDGSIYFIDWYDRQNCHRREPEIWDRSNGRLYRLRYGDTVGGEVDVGSMSDGALVGLLGDSREWWARTARRVLQERAAAGTLDAAMVHVALRGWLRAEADPVKRLRALWGLEVTGGLDDAWLVGEMADRDEAVRTWAVTLAGDDAWVLSSARDKMERMAKSDPSAAVRLSLASVMQRMPLGGRWGIAEGLLSHGEDGADQNLPLVTWYGVEPLVEADVERALALGARSKVEKVSRFIVRRAVSVEGGLEAAVAALGEAGDGHGAVWMAEEILAAVEKRPDIDPPMSWRAAYAGLRDTLDVGLRNTMRELAVRFGDETTFPELRRVLADRTVAPGQRLRAAKVLAAARDGASRGVFVELLAGGDGAMRVAALRGLAKLGGDGVGVAVLAAYAGFSVGERAEAVGMLASRELWAAELLQAVGDGRVARGEVSAFVARQIRGFGDADLDVLLGETWGQVSAGTADEVAAEMTRYRAKLTPAVLAKADLPNGRAVYERTCGVCHTLYGSGGRIGPDITGSNRRNFDYLMENVLDPNAVVGRDYQLNVATLAGGSVVSGMVQDENESAVTLRQVNGEDVVVAKRELAKREVLAVSLMPPGQLQSLAEADARDLVAYLMAAGQVPLPGEGPFLNPATGKVDGALEGEGLEVVAVSAGEARPQAMGNYKADRWSGPAQLWWTGTKVGDSMTLALPVEAMGSYEVFAVMTKARDYGVFSLTVDGKPGLQGMDLYDANGVVTTGVVSLGVHRLSPGRHQLGVVVEGKNAGASGTMFGLDYVWMKQVEGGE